MSATRTIQGGYRTKANTGGGGGRGRPIYKGNMDFTTEDITRTNGYYNFELNADRGSRPLQQSKVKSDWDKYETPPASVKTYSVVIDPENIICFSGRGHYLSNLNSCEITIDGCVYTSVEHYYQATKLFMLAGSQYSNQIKRIPDPGTAKTFARQTLRGMQHASTIDQWRRVEGLRMIDYAIRHKFRQREDLRNKLMASGNALLVHAYDKDTVLASGMSQKDMIGWAEENKGKTIQIPVQLTPETQKYFPKVGKGKNLLGALLMRTRDRLNNAIKGLPDPEDDQTDPALLASMEAMKLEMDHNKVELERKDAEIARLKVEASDSDVSIQVSP